MIPGQKPFVTEMAEGLTPVRKEALHLKRWKAATISLG